MRQQKRWKLRAALLVSLCAVMLTGCHGAKAQTGGFEIPEEFDESQKYEITFWAKK
jgi:multiple sugar transport system substrate-binding protein